MCRYVAHDIEYASSAVVELQDQFTVAVVQWKLCLWRQLESSEKMTPVTSSGLSHLCYKLVGHLPGEEGLTKDAIEWHWGNYRTQ